MTTNNIVLPSNTDAEQAVLGACFIKPEAIHTAMEILQPSDFYRPQNQLFFEALMKLADRDENIDILTVTEQLRRAGNLEKVDGISYVTLVANYVPTAVGVERHAKMVKEASDRRALLDMCIKIRAATLDVSRDLNVTRVEALTALTKQGTSASTGGEVIKPATDFVPDFVNRLKVPMPCFSTGLPMLDEMLDGGIYAGLYALGAISSLGKTTFALQLADYIAATGQDVLFFSLEMSRDELLAKSLSRHTYVLDKSLKHVHAKTARQILKGAVDRRKVDKNVFLDATDAYMDGAGQHIFFIPQADIGVRDIRAGILSHKARTGNTPLIVIDYLQLLEPDNPRATDKQNMDHNIKGLKAISRDFKTPIIAISSFNRDNYNSPVNMAALKESGSIEYTADFIIALQYAYMAAIPGESEVARKKRVATEKLHMQANAKEGLPLLINAVILKNRFGLKGECCLNFLPKYNIYETTNEKIPDIVADPF